MPDLPRIEVPQEVIILPLDECPQIIETPNSENGSKFIIDWSTQNGNGSKIIEMLYERKIGLKEKDLSLFFQKFQTLKEEHGFLTAYATCASTDMDSFALCRLTIPESTIMNIFTGVKSLSVDSNTYLNSGNIVSTKNINNIYQALFLRDSLVKYWEIVGLKFSDTTNRIP